MNDNVDQPNNISVKEATAPEEGDASIELMGINSLALVTPQRNTDNDGQVIIPNTQQVQRHSQR